MKRLAFLPVLLLLLLLLSGCAAPAWDLDGRDSIEISSGPWTFGAPRNAGFGQHIIAINQRLEQLGITSGGAFAASTLQATVDAGSAVTTAMQATGANTFGASGITTTFTGAVDDVTIVDGVVLAQALRAAPGTTLEIKTENGTNAILIANSLITLRRPTQILDGNAIDFGTATGGDTFIQGQGDLTVPDNTLTTILTATTTTTDYAFLHIKYVVSFNDSGEVAMESGEAFFTFANDATSGRLAGSPVEVGVVQALTSGETLATTWAIDTSADAMLIQLTADAAMDGGGTPGNATLDWWVVASGNIAVAQ